MHWQFTPFILPLFIAAIVSVSLAIYAWARRATPGSMTLTFLMLAVAEWSLAYVLEVASTGLQAKIFWSKLEYLGIVTVPVTWLVFVMQYTGRERWLKRRNLVLLSILPVLTVLLAWTNEAHHLIWSTVDLVAMADGSLGWDATYGWGFWVHATYAYAVLVIAGLSLIWTLVRSPRLYREQVIALLLAVVMPWVGNILSIFGLVQIPIDLTPVGFAFAGAMVAWGFFRFKLLDILPVARDAVVESMVDGMIVLDLENRIIDLNPAMQRMIGCEASDVVGLPIENALSARDDLIKGYHHAVSSSAETTVRIRPCGDIRADAAKREPEERYYELRVSPLALRRGRTTGRLLVFRDVTEHKSAEEALRAQKQLFEGLVSVARATTERPTLEATLQDALTASTALTGAEYGTLLLLDENGAVTHNVISRGEEPLPQWREFSEQVMGEGLAGWVVKRREPALIEDTHRDERWLDIPSTVSTARAALAVPIISGSGVLGILTLTHSSPGHFRAEHANLMQAAADQMMLALRNAQIFDAQQRIAEQQSTLYQVLRAIVGQLDPEDVARAALKSIAQFAGWRNVAVALLNEERTDWEIRGYGENEPPASGQRFSIEDGIVGRALCTVQTQYVSDVTADLDYIVKYPGIQSQLVVPLRHGENLLGALDIESETPNAFDDKDVLLAESLADAMALAMESARHYSETRQQAADLSTLYTVTRMTSQSLSLERVLSQALSAVLISLEFEAGVIALSDSEDGRLYMAAEHDLPRHLSDRFSAKGMGGSISEYVHVRRESLVIHDLRTEKRKELATLAADMVRFGLRGYGGIPLLHRDTSLGTMSLFSHRRRRFSQNQIVLLETIGRQVAAAVANARLFQATVNERQRLTTLIESSRDGIALISLDEQIRVVNTTAIEFLRLPGLPAHWTDRPMRDALEALQSHAPEAVEAMGSEMARIQVGDEPPSEWECAVPPRFIHWFNLPVVADTTSLGRLLVLRDVTEERMLTKMRDDLTHTMVHDLRNPLTGISTAMKLLNRKLSDVLTPAQTRLFEIADDSAQKMIDLVSAILDVSRLESGRMPIVPAPVSLSELIAETMALQSPLATARELHLGADVPPDLPVAWADAELIGRVLQNLVGNAIKFTPTEGRVQVSARLWDGERKEETGPLLCISVTDTGPGIPPELRGNLFQKFVVGEHEAHGSGLGLAFCKLAVEAHDGHIWVESEPEMGTTFKFTLPTAATGERA